MLLGQAAGMGGLPVESGAAGGPLSVVHAVHATRERDAIPALRTLGVSGTSLVGLQAEVYSKQQDGSSGRDGAAARRVSGSGGAALGGTNRGVRERDRRDRLEIKSARDRLSESERALERKALRYEALAAGAEPGEGEEYEVDFLLKPLEPSTGGGVAGAAACGEGALAPELDTAGLAAEGGGGGMRSADMAREAERREWEAQMEVQERAAAARADRRKIIADVAQQTTAARQRAAQLRAVKKMELEQKRAQLKADFLRKQAEAVKAARQRHRKTETAAPDSTHGGEE